DFLDQALPALGDDEDVRALPVLAHRVGQALLAPLLDLLDAAALLLDVALDEGGEGVHLRLPEVGVGDEQDLVGAIAHGALISFRISGAGGRSPRAPFGPQVPYREQGSVGRAPRR